MPRLDIFTLPTPAPPRVVAEQGLHAGRNLLARAPALEARGQIRAHDRGGALAEAGNRGDERHALGGQPCAMLGKEFFELLPAGLVGGERAAPALF